MTISNDSFPKTQYLIATTMQRYGGGFVQLLGAALLRADRVNAQIMLDAYADLLTDYTPGGRFYDKELLPAA